LRLRAAIEVEASRVTFREVLSYIALDKTFSGTLPQWLFPQHFQPVTERKKKRRRGANRIEYHEVG